MLIELNYHIHEFSQVRGRHKHSSNRLSKNFHAALTRNSHISVNNEHCLSFSQPDAKLYHTNGVQY